MKKLLYLFMAFAMTLCIISPITANASTPTSQHEQIVAVASTTGALEGPAQFVIVGHSYLKQCSFSIINQSRTHFDLINAGRSHLRTLHNHAHLCANMISPFRYRSVNST